MNSKLSFWIRHLHFLLCVGLFALLVARNPFGIRTQIPNFEPYPDSFHYVVPARSLLAGTGPYLTREGRKLNPSVPMGYSLALIPFFIVKNDPRMFYIANVLMAFVSLGLFYWILHRLHIRKSIQFLVLFLYVTNYYMYWYPTLAMAENLTTVLFFMSVGLLLIRVTPKRALLAAILSVGFYATKYANIPLTGALALLYFIKIVLPVESVWTRKKSLLTFVIGGLASFGTFSLWEYFFYGKSVLNALTALFPVHASTTSAPVQAVKQGQSTGFFSLSYVPNNLKFYMQMVMGRPTRMLWSFVPLTPMVVAIPGLAALMAYVADARRRFFVVSLLLFALANIAFLSTFYAPDARYFLYLIPSLLFGVALLLTAISSMLVKHGLSKFFTMGVFGLLIFAVGTSALRLKNQIALNLRHSETPWYYISVLELNHAVDDLHLSQKPVVISSLPPYLVDFYSQDKYTLLPLDENQEFRNNKNIVFGDDDYSNLHALYRQQIEAGKTVLVEKYGLGNEKYLQDSFANLSRDFTMTVVREGCHNLCNVYSLTLKK